MNFMRRRQYPAAPPPAEMGYYGEPVYAEAGYGYAGPDYGEPAYYGEPIEYYGEAPEYGYYGEPEMGFAEADYGDYGDYGEGEYGEMEPVGYYAAPPELVGWGVGEDPSGLGCSCQAGRMQGYGGYGAYVADRPPRSIPNVIAATNLNGYGYGEADYGEPEYGEAEYGQSEYGEPEYGEAEYAGYGEADYGTAGYGEADYGESDYGESDYGEADLAENDLGAYVAPADVSPTCNNFAPSAQPTPVADAFRPYF